MTRTDATRSISRSTESIAGAATSTGCAVSTQSPPVSPSGVSAAALAEIHQTFIGRVHSQSVPVSGVDFSSAPRHAKPIVVANGRLYMDSAPASVTLDGLMSFASLDAFEQWLALPGPRLTGFDLPFGLPRELVLAQGWPEQWAACIDTYAGLSREQLRVRFKAFCDARPVGGKFAHRQTDRPAGSSPSMKWVNPPVAWMLHAGVPRLIRAGLTLPGQSVGDPVRIGLEAYPGLLARSVTRASYKSDDKSRQTDARRDERERLIGALVAGATQPGLVTNLSDAQRLTLLSDASGDSLDAVFCLVQAAWGLLRQQADFGLKPGFDPLEGWIVGAGLT